MIIHFLFFHYDDRMTTTMIHPWIQCGKSIDIGGKSILFDRHSRFRLGDIGRIRWFDHFLMTVTIIAVVIVMIVVAVVVVPMVTTTTVCLCRVLFRWCVRFIWQRMMRSLTQTIHLIPTTTTTRTTTIFRRGIRQGRRADTGIVQCRMLLLCG